MVARPEYGIERLLATWSETAVIEGRLRGGYRNTLWSVRIAGRRYAARLSERPVPALEWEVRLLQHLRGAGMWAPEVLPARDGRSQVDGLILFSWLEGEPPSSEHDWQLVAEELRRLHDLTRDWPQRPGFCSSLQLMDEEVGGGLRLDLMPAEVVERVRAAWRLLRGEQTSVVHGDPGAGNIRVYKGRVGFIDWDEARVDVSLLDLAALLEGVRLPVDREKLERARQGAVAWEVANGWVVEPEYARRRLEELEAGTRHTP